MSVYTYAVFPSIITEIECPCFEMIQPSLIEWIYQYQKNNPESSQRSNRGGWQSSSVNSWWNEESFSQYKEYILKSAFSEIGFYNQNFVLGNMWININNPNSYNTVHNHPGCDLSGVLWVKTPERSGSLLFRSPNSFIEYALTINMDNHLEKNRYYCGETFGFQNPKAGIMVLFPAHLNHEVTENLSDENRISIAFNLSVGPS